MTKILWLLFIANAPGLNSATLGMETFQTREECEATRAAIIKNTESWWTGRIDDDEIFCWEVRP